MIFNALLAVLWRGKLSGYLLDHGNDRLEQFKIIPRVAFGRLKEQHRRATYLHTYTRGAQIRSNGGDGLAKRASWLDRPYPDSTTASLGLQRRRLDVQTVPHQRIRQIKTDLHSNHAIPSAHAPCTVAELEVQIKTPDRPTPNSAIGNISGM